MATKNKPAGAKSPQQADEKSKHIATVTTLPSANGAAVIEAFGKSSFGEQDISLLTRGLSESMKELNAGDVRRVENMLYGQAHALQSIFVNLARRASGQEYLKQYETFLRLALKAQSQCRATLETLAAIKNPPVVIARQANIANGHQQINNGAGTPAHAREIESDQTKLLEAQHGNHLDTGATGAAINRHKDVATVGAFDRTKDDRG